MLALEEEGEEGFGIPDVDVVVDVAPPEMPDRPAESEVDSSTSEESADAEW